GFDPSWRLDETYVKVRGKWTYLYRAVDKRGDTIDFYLSPTRSAKAAKPLLHLRGVALDPAIDRRMVDRNAAFRQHFLKVAIADRIATIPAHRPQDHITLEMAPLEIRHRSVRTISAKHAQASRFLQQSHSDRSQFALISSSMFISWQKMI